MKKCPDCAEMIDDAAIVCPECKATLSQSAPRKAMQSVDYVETVPASSGLWMSITSMILGILSILCAFDDGEWDAETALGFLIFCVLALVFGIIAIVQKKAGRGMAIAGVVTAAIAVLLAL